MEVIGSSARLRDFCCTYYSKRNDANSRTGRTRTIADHVRRDKYSRACAHSSTHNGTRTNSSLFHGLLFPLISSDVSLLLSVHQPSTYRKLFQKLLSKCLEMPLVVNPTSSRCDICLENYNDTTNRAVVLPCGMYSLHFISKTRCCTLLIHYVSIRPLIVSSLFYLHLQ